MAQSRLLSKDEFKVAIKHAINLPLLEDEHELLMSLDQKERKPNSLKFPVNDQIGYLFHTQNLRGAAAIVLFTPCNYHVRNTSKLKLEGNASLNGETVSGHILVNLSTKETCMRINGHQHFYKLTIDPSSQNAWMTFLNGLHIDS